MARNRTKLLRIAGTLRPEAERILREITGFAELPLRETRTSEILSTFLADHGFRVERGVAGMDTAFRAEFPLHCYHMPKNYTIQKVLWIH